MNIERSNKWKPELNTRREPRRNKKEWICSPIAITASPRTSVSLCAPSLPSLISAGTFQLQQPPGSASPLGWNIRRKTDSRPARVCICPLSIPSPFPPPSPVFLRGHFTGASGGRCVSAYRLLYFLGHGTTSICRHLSGRTIFGRLQQVRTCTVVCRTWKPATALLSSEQVSWSPSCP
jgi:hypothetical protein